MKKETVKKIITSLLLTMMLSSFIDRKVEANSLPLGNMGQVKVMNMIKRLSPEGKARIMKIVSDYIAKKGSGKFLEVVLRKEAKKRIFQYALGRPGPLPQFPKLSYTIKRRIFHASWFNWIVLFDILLHQEPHSPRNPVERYRRTNLAFTGANLLDLETKSKEQILEKKSKLLSLMQKADHTENSSMLPEIKTLENELRDLENNPPNKWLQNYIEDLTLGEMETIILAGEVNILSRIAKEYRPIVVSLFSDNFWNEMKTRPNNDFWNKVRKILNKYKY